MTTTPPPEPGPDLQELAEESPAESLDREADTVGETADVGETVPPDQAQ